MKRFNRLFQLNAINIAVIYVVFGGLWILFSDKLLKLFISDIETLSQYGTFKGIFYVLVTGTLLYLLVNFSNKHIKQASKRVDKALDSVKIATWSIDLETGRNVTSSHHFKLFGLKKEPKKWNVNDFYSRIHPDDKNRVEQAFNEAIANKDPYKAEYRIIWPDDSIRWMRSLGNVQKNARGEAVMISGIIQDITEQVELEEQHELKQELFERIFEQIPVMVDIYDPEINEIRVNKAFENTLGWSNEEIKEIDLMSASYPDPKERERAAKVMKEADGQWYRFEVKDKQGNAHIQEWSNIQLSDNSIVGIGLDITELTASQDKIIESRQLLQKTFESLKEAVFILEPYTRTITDCNKSCTDLFGYTKEELIGNNTRLLHLNEQKYNEFDELSSGSLEKNGIFQSEFMMQKKDGTRFYSEHTVTLVKNEAGEIEKVVSVVQDITSQKEYEKELKNQIDFIETTIENLPIGVAVNLIDSGDVTLMNKRFSEIYGWPKNIINDVQTFFEKVYPDTHYRKKMAEMITDDLKSKNPDRMQWKGIKITTQTGEERIINAKNIPVYDQNLMISTVVDVTAQVEAEKKLAESEHNYRLLFQKSPQPMLIYNPENLSIVEVNESAVRHYGYTRQEFYTKTLLDIRPEEDKDESKQIIQGDRKTALSESLESRHIKKNGEIINVRVTGSAINYFGKSYRLVLVNDITEQKKAEEMVLASLVEGENKERARIAQELHDGLGQYLAAANMNLDAVESQISELDERKQDQFNKGLNLLKHAVNETAQISRNLMPRVVDDYGLGLAIEALVDNYSTGNEMDISFYQNIDGLNLPREVQFNLYRIAQEALSNAVKYSEASKINVQLIKDELDLILTIDDNGIGFDTSDPDFKPGLGLQTIKTRTGALGGDFEFDSKPGKGTLISAIVPINKQSNA
ncbi:MAG: PAS domain S-box protein [Gracilimonas sp.]|uniref:PAS domain-containing sensor histidine kinase n=1 Tax=Gracilimonas TaxID=649462 RepID=UPI001B050E9A|nr:PAS domain S-box protein [Gracilimonas sp.]MBO6584567.1 PAS domain S-box protein [Gracilimonas sp.]MBO6616162.1 PAS domain S-box protein [Gracilimonas sp.]